MSRLKQSQTRNRQGRLPPLGCTFSADSSHPRVAVGDEAKCPYEPAFLLNTDELEQILPNVINQSASLKAWIAYRLKTKGLKEKCDLEARVPTWERVWDVIQDEGAVWTTQYERIVLQTTQWEFEQPNSTLDLLASALVVLYCKVQENRIAADQGVRGLKWHPYYYEEAGKFFLLYRFIRCVNSLLGPNRSTSIHPPIDVSKMAAWRHSPGYLIRQASRDFMKDLDWNPLDMLSTSVKSRTTKRESRPDLDKTVTFVVTLSSGGQLIRTDIESIRRSAAIYMDLLGTLENFLDLPTVPFCVSNGQDNTAIRSLEELWKFIDSAEEPFIRLCTWTTNTLVVVPSRTIERTLQQNYSNHAILKLEHMVDKLDNQEQSRLSHQSRFTLIRENHRHSADFVKELEEHFVSLDQTTTSRWRQLSERKAMCEAAMQDMAQIYKLRDFTANLSDVQRNHAQQYFELINSNNPLANFAAEHLIKLLMPDDAEWEEVSSRKNIFDEIRKDTSQQS